MGRRALLRRVRRESPPAFHPSAPSGAVAPHSTQTRFLGGLHVSSNEHDTSGPRPRIERGPTIVGMDKKSPKSCFVCSECGKADDGLRGWKMRLDLAGKLYPFCPDCDQREFSET